MKNSRLLVILASCLPLFASAAQAAKAEGPKAKLMAKYDVNHNGVIDGDEIAAVKKAFAEAPEGELKRFDANKDGKLDDTEIAAIKAPGGKGKGEKKDEKATKKEGEKQE
jgi:hypothetical protein